MKKISHRDFLKLDGVTMIAIAESLFLYIPDDKSSDPRAQCTFY